MVLPDRYALTTSGLTGSSSSSKTPRASVAFRTVRRTRRRFFARKRNVTSSSSTVAWRFVSVVMP